MAKRQQKRLASIAGFIQLPLPLRLTGGCHADVRRYHFVKRLKAANPHTGTATANASGRSGGGGSGGRTALGNENSEVGADDSLHASEETVDHRLRTILVANFDGNEAELRRIYGVYGLIESASCGKCGPMAKGIARVVFNAADAVDKIMSLDSQRADQYAALVAAKEEALEEGASAAAQVDSGNENSDSGNESDGEININFDAPGCGRSAAEEQEEEERPSMGLQKWLAMHFDARPGISALQERIDTRMAGYDERRRAEEKRQAAALNVPDEDGFITVTRGARGGRTANSDGTVHVKSGSASRAIAAEAAAAKAQREAGLRDFYRFQTRDKRQREISSLRQQFQADRLKLARAKQLRLTRTA